MNYYNEFDPAAAAWLRELIRRDLIAPGIVDERSIEDVTPADLAGFRQCHFFAGIGGWSRALRLAGWPDDRPVWTGSCPCQPFSVAGAGAGVSDPRHLWPEFRRLIAECRPPAVFGEQVASRLGRDWLSAVRADLEAVGYAVGAADLCAAGVGAPHIRQRLYWVADIERRGWAGIGGVADATRERRTGEPVLLRPENSGRGEEALPEVARSSTASGMADTDGGVSCDRELQRSGQYSERAEDGAASRMGDTDIEGPQGRQQRGLSAIERSPWSAGVALLCTDGRTRLIEPGSFPLAHGVPARVGRLRGYGNAIVPQVAAAFVMAALGVSKQTVRGIRLGEPVTLTWGHEPDKIRDVW